MKIVLWTAGTINDCLLERNILKKIYGDVTVVGTVAEVIDEEERQNLDGKEFGQILRPEQILDFDFDIILLTGERGDSPAAIKRICSFGIAAERIVLDRVVRFPGFTVERYNALRSANLSILSIDCFAGILYHSLGIPFQTPTINMFQSEGDFLKFLSAPKKYMDMSLEFRGLESEPAPSMNVNYPVFALGDILLHMNHWGKLGPEVARKKWEERKKRINWDNLLIFMKTQDKKMLERFAALPYEKKICLTSVKSDLPCAYYVQPKYFAGKPFWRAMSEVGRGSIYEYDLWEFLLSGRKVEQTPPVLPARLPGEKKKVLFFALFPAVMYMCLAYKYETYKDDDVTLVVDKGVFQQRGYDKYLSRLVEQGIFTEVKYASLMLDRKRMPKEKATFKAYVNSYFDVQFDMADFSLINFQELVVFQYSWCSDISLYLNYKRIYYQWMQLVSGDLMIRKGRRYPKGILQEEMKFYQAESAVAPYARPVLLEVSAAAREKLQDREFQFWSPTKVLAGMEESFLEKVLACYDFCLDDTDRVNLLVLNSNGSIQGSPAVTTIKSDAGKCKIYGFSECGYGEIMGTNYAFLMDIFFQGKGNIYVKSHPNDPMSAEEVTETFGNGAKKFTEAPFEFVCAYLRRKDMKFGEVVGISSGALSSLDATVCGRSIVLTDQFFSYMQFYCSLYVIVQLIFEMKIQRVFCAARLLENLKALASIREGDNCLVTMEKLDETNFQRLGMRDMVVLDMEDAMLSVELFNKLKPGSLMLLNGRGCAASLPKNFLYECVPVEIRKVPVGENDYRPLFHGELMWFWSADRTLRNFVRRFCFEKQMGYTGCTLSLIRHTLEEEVGLAESQTSRNDLAMVKVLGLDVSGRCERLEKLVTCSLRSLAEKMNPLELRDFLKGTTEIYSYLKLLSVLKEKYVVIIAVKDTPGDKLSEDVINAIHAMGFEKFSKDLWRMYVGVANKGRMLCDKYGEKRGAPVEVEIKNETNRLLVRSMAWRRGNAAQIIINNIDWAVNIRGLNIVVYDSITDTVIDSVAYDGHQLSGRFLRRNLG